MKLAIVFDPSRTFPVQHRARNTREVRGVHAQIIEELMSRPTVWAKVSEKKLTEKEFNSLATAIRTSTRFGLHFQLTVDERGFSWARYVGKQAVPVRGRCAA